MAKDEEPIDLDKLSARELLIICAKDVRELKEDMKDVRKEQIAQALKINGLEEKSRSSSRAWGAAMGFITGGVTILIEKVLK